MRRRILLLVVGVTALVILAFAIPLAVLIRSAVEQNTANATVTRAEDVARFMRSQPTTAQLAAYLSTLTQSSDACTSVILPGGVVVGTLPPSGSVPATPQSGGGYGLPTSPAVPSRTAGGYPQSGDDPGGGNDRLASAQLHDVQDGKVATVTVPVNGGQAQVMAYVSTGLLHNGVAKWWTLVGAGSLALLIIGIVAGELLTRRIVRPLLRTALTANQLSAGDVTARAPTTGPREVAEVGSALNRLADRIDELIAEERETVADMSHRMRTPLTALRLDAEALRDSGESERIAGHVSTLERTLTAVIRAARRPQREGLVPAADATAVVGERVMFWSALADDQNRPSTVTLPDRPLIVRAAAADLAAAVDALLENVIAHTPEGTSFAVRLTPCEPGARLDVADAGPGLPDGAGERGRSDRGSSGLGLDIARRCAQASGGEMRIGRSDLGGALITLQLGPP